jgi:hypothetical protein
MTVQSRQRRWGAAGWAISLVGAGLLTRSACTPVPSSGARVPSAPAGEAHMAEATRGATNDAVPAHPVAGMSPDIDTAVLPPPAPAVRDTPFTAGKDPQPVAADITTSTTAATSGGLPAIERQEIALLASIERDLKREPPPEVHALLGEYRRGADRATLLTSVQREFPNDLPLRVTLLRWIDQVRPEPGHSSRALGVPGQGTGKSWVRPLERR